MAERENDEEAPTDVIVKVISLDEKRRWQVTVRTDINIEELRDTIAQEADYYASQIRLICMGLELLNMDLEVGDVANGSTTISVVLVPSGAADLEVFIRVRPLPDDTLDCVRFAMNADAPLQWLVDKICKYYQWQGCKLVSDGQLLKDAKKTIRDVLSPRDPEVVAICVSGPSAASNFCGKCRKRIGGYIGRRGNAVIDFFAGYWNSFFGAVAVVANDPWTLVRPAPPPQGYRADRFEVGFWNHNRRNRMRYAPGQNRQGEDLTNLLMQGMAGM